MDPATDAAKYPEHAKLDGARDRYEPVKMFVKWLEGEGLILGKPYGPDMMDRGPSGVTQVSDTEALVFRFVGVDVAKLKQERQAMLDEYRLGRKGT